MNLNELYPRPSFAASLDGSPYGAIVLKNGLPTRTVSSIEDGKILLKELVASGQVSPDDADRIEDHLNLSELPEVSPVFEVVVVLCVLAPSAASCDPEKSDHHKHRCTECSHEWEHGAECAANREAHTCPNCGNLQWARVGEH